MTSTTDFRLDPAEGFEFELLMKAISFVFNHKSDEFVEVPMDVIKQREYIVITMRQRCRVCQIEQRENMNDIPLWSVHGILKQEMAKIMGEPRIGWNPEAAASEVIQEALFALRTTWGDDVDDATEFLSRNNYPLIKIRTI